MRQSLDAWIKDSSIEKDPRAIVPGRAVVIELIGSVTNFEIAATTLGFEWFGSAYAIDQKFNDDEQELDEDQSATASILYLTLPSEKALKQLLTNWDKFILGRDAQTREEKTLWTLFAYLSNIRLWSPKDRIDSAVTEYIADLLKHDPSRPVIVEINLWFRASLAERTNAFNSLNELLKTEEVEILDSALIEEIQYHAVLVRVPAIIAKQIVLRDGSLANESSIFAIRTQSIESEQSHPIEGIETNPNLSDISNKPCIGAIIDGSPVSAHYFLDGRLIILGKDILNPSAMVNSRYHGTAMASLILHGDLNMVKAESLDRKLAVVPVLVDFNGKESIPKDRLPVKVIYEAILALNDGMPSEGIEKNQIVIVNHSLCNVLAPCNGRPSPWATLLDHFADKFKMLFVVSAGNSEHGIPIDAFDTHAEFTSANEAERVGATLLAVEKARHSRPILSPAESVNGLTVGALHIDDGPAVPDHLYDPYPGYEMVALSSTSGLGIGRSVKPDLVEAGGKTMAIIYASNDKPLIRALRSALVGQKTASPDPYTGQLNRTALSSGTSNAAALITRAALQIADVVEQVYVKDGDNWLEKPTRAVIIKALVAHSCRWNTVAEKLDEIFPPADSKMWAQRRAAITSLMGYGRPNVSLVENGSTNRITLIADDQIVNDQLHEYRVPLPSDFKNTSEIKRIVITLAWSTPVSVSTAAYRGVTLNFVNSEGKKNIWDKVKRKLQPNTSNSERGTLIHLVLEGESRTKVLDQNGIFICVQARSLSKQFDMSLIPYALAVSLELGAQQNSNLYTEVRDAIRIRSEQKSRIGQRT